MSEGLGVIEILMTIKDRQDYLTKQVEYLKPFLSSELYLTVYDDGSSPPLVLPESIEHARILRGDENKGLIEARNVLLSSSFEDVEYVLFLDDDIFIYNFELFLNHALDVLKHDKSILAVSCPYINLPSKKYGQISTFKKLFDTDRTDSNYVSYFFGGTSLFDKAMLIDIGGLEGKYKIYLEEEDLAIRAFSKSQYFKILYSNNFIAIHDQASGKNLAERSIYLLSNRMLFHYKFVNSVVLRFFLNIGYIFIYLCKHKNLRMIFDSWRRYNSLRSEFSQYEFPGLLIFKFFIKRFF